MAIQSKAAIRAVRTISGTPLPKQHVPEKANLTAKKGALCVVAATGYLDECAADPTLVLGIMTGDGQNAASPGLKNQIVELAMPGVLFRGYVDGATETTGVTAVTDLFKKYGVAKSATNGIWFVDKSETTKPVVVIWEFANDGNQAIGDIRHHVLFSFITSIFQGLVGA